MESTEDKKTFKVVLVVLLLILITFVSCPRLRAQTWQKEAEISIGIEDRNMKFLDEMFPWLMNTKFTQIDIVVSPPIFDNSLFLYASTKTWMEQKKLTSYKPLQVQYWVGAGYIWRDFQISYEHMCSHSVDIAVFRESINKFTVSYKIFK